MGTGSSKESATPEQKSQIGVFVLGRKETQAVRTLSTILTKMLDANRLFDINALLTTDDPESGCNSLFMVIQSTIESEFLRLKFPDPKVSSAITGITTVPTKYYSDSLASRSGRQAMCRDLTHFLVRLITLVAALATSITSNKNLKELMAPASPEDKEEPLGRLKMTDVLRKLEKPSTTIPDFLTEKAFLVKKKDLYVFKDTDFTIQTDRMLLYNAGKPMTPVFTISIEDRDEQLPVIRRVSPTGLTPAPALALAPVPATTGLAPALAPVPATNGLAPAPGRMGGTTVITNTNGVSTIASSRRTRRYRARRQTTRRVRRQHGGGAKDSSQSLFRITISFVGKIQTIVFLTNALGDTYEQNIMSYSADASRGPLPQAVPIRDRIYGIFQQAEQANLASFATEKVEIGAEAPKEVLAGLQSRDKNLSSTTIKKLKEEFSTLNKEGTGTAPAPYRAFLLASESVGSGVLHMLCSDAWRGQWVTSVVAYSLFQALFNDTVDGHMSARNAEECRKMMKSFSQTGAMKESAPSGELATSFSNMRFTDLPDVFKVSICAQTKSVNPTREESIPGDIAILRKAHNDIRLAYEAYIDKLIPFTLSIVKVARIINDEKQDYTFRLDPAFFTTEGTSLAYLENKIAEARLLIGSHLLTVETIYANAIKALELSKKGISTPDTA